VADVLKELRLTLLAAWGKVAQHNCGGGGPPAVGPFEKTGQLEMGFEYFYGSSRGEACSMRPKNLVRALTHVRSRRPEPRTRATI